MGIGWNSSSGWPRHGLKNSNKEIKGLLEKKSDKNWLQPISFSHCLDILTATGTSCQEKKIVCSRRFLFSMDGGICGFTGIVSLVYRCWIRVKGTRWWSTIVLCELCLPRLCVGVLKCYHGGTKKIGSQSCQLLIITREHEPSMTT